MNNGFFKSLAFRRYRWIRRASPSFEDEVKGILDDYPILEESTKLEILEKVVDAFNNRFTKLHEVWNKFGNNLVHNLE